MIEDKGESLEIHSFSKDTKSRTFRISGFIFRPGAPDGILALGGKFARDLHANLSSWAQEFIKPIFPSKLFIIPPPENHFPRWLCAAKVICDDPVPREESTLVDKMGWSELVIVWFTDNIDYGITQMVANKLIDIDWEKEAINDCF
jgi:hypothetical protein